MEREIVSKVSLRLHGRSGLMFMLTHPLTHELCKKVLN